MYKIEINDGLARSISAADRSQLIDAVSEYYGEPIRCTESDDGEELVLPNGLIIGVMVRQ